jgi:hypothetical protein
MEEVESMQLDSPVDNFFVMGFVLDGHDHDHDHDH